MNLTQNGIDTQNLSIRRSYLRLELLDLNFKVIDTIEGECIGGSITKNANDDLRRSGNVIIAIPTDKSSITFLDSIGQYSVEVGGKIWLDKYIKVFVGIENLNIMPIKIEWFSFGICLIDQPTRNFNSTQYEISFNLIDLMAKLTGLRQGQLTGMTTVIPKGYYLENIDMPQIAPIYVKTKIDEELTAIIQKLGGFNKISINPIPEEYRYLPYDIKVGVGGTVFDLLKQLMKLIPNWQMYFDDDGIFTISPIPNGENDLVFPLNKEHIINDTMSYNFQNVKNQIVVYGRLNNLSYYTENTVTEPTNVQYIPEGIDNILSLKYKSISAESVTIAGSVFGFKSLETYNSITFNKIRIYNGDTILVDKFLGSFVDFENINSSVAINSFIPNQIYAVRILNATLTTTKKIDFTKAITFEFFGKQQVSTCIVNDNIESPYYINASIDTPNFYGGMCLGIQDNYEITINNTQQLSALPNNTLIAFMANHTNIVNQNVTILTQNKTVLLNNIPIVENKFNSSGGRNAVEPNSISSNYTIWLLKYDSINNYFIFIGRHPSVLTQVLSGGEYDNIYSDWYANEEAKWKLYKHSNLNNSIILDIIPNFLLDVNIKFPYYPNNSVPLGVKNYQPYFVNETNTYTQFSTLSNNHTSRENFYVEYNLPKYYLTKSVTYPFNLDGSTQNINAIEIYDKTNII